MKGAREKRIWKWAGKMDGPMEDLVTVEEPLELRLNYFNGMVWKDFPLAVTMRTPGHDEEWARGFLYTEGVVKQMDDIEQVRLLPPEPGAMATGTIQVKLGRDVRFEPDRNERHFYMNSSCGVCGKTAVDQVRQNVPFILAEGKPGVSRRLLGKLPDKLLNATPLFRKTGSIHATALFDPEGKLLLYREDVGRHNAMDKLIGAAWNNYGLPLPDKICLVSGRASFELVQKALMAGIPILCAIGAPSSLAVELADAHQMSLIGFLKKNRFNVYTGPERFLSN